jgi:transcriptional regulator with XRE-family HTH domain
VKKFTKSEQLWRILSTNIKAKREVLRLSQEKLAELAEVSPQMINCIEGCRTWVSDKMLVKLAAALEVETFQLLLPVVDAKVKKDSFLSGLLDNLQQNIKDDIDSRFAGLRC